MTPDRTFWSRRSARGHATRLARTVGLAQLPWIWLCSCGRWHVSWTQPQAGEEVHQWPGEEVHQWPAWAVRYLRTCNVCERPLHASNRCRTCSAVAYDVTPLRLQVRIAEAAAAGDRPEVDRLLGLLAAARRGGDTANPGPHGGLRQ